MERPIRHHMRSQSSDSLVSSSSAGFIYVHPASPEQGGPRAWNPVEGLSPSSGAGPSINNVPRKQRRQKMFGFTPAGPSTTAPSMSALDANDDGPSSQEASPLEDNSTTSSAVASTSTSKEVSGPPLIPVSLRPSLHAKYATTPNSRKVSDLEASFPSMRQTAMLRKKSGELVRSSLKTDFGRDRGTNKPRSEPATPTCPKYVHFDTQLEHVKHFLSQQRPAAVSRTGSPIETETEDEPESFPFPAMANAEAGTLQIKLPNFPTRIDHALDAYVESIDVAADGKSLRGVVRVKNLAFEKWVAVRFTLDQWQTVSEVSGEHLESMGSMSDRFVFHIKLQDLLARIEEKTMFIAVRYTVGGREIWDNNDGANYRVEFSKLPPTPAPSVPTTSKRQHWSVTNAGQAADRMADLRRELDRLVKDDLDPSTRTFTDGSTSAFSTRYDFGNSLKMFGGRQQPSQDGAGQPPPASPTKVLSPYQSTTFVNGMPATVYPDPKPSSPLATRANLPPDFGSYRPAGGGSYPAYQQAQRPPSPPPEHETANGIGMYATAYGYPPQKELTLPPGSGRGRFASYPVGNGSSHQPQQPPLMSYVPLLPPSFRDHRRRDSPFASPTDSPTFSPVPSPALSPASSSPPRSQSPTLYPTVSPEEVWSPSSSLDTASTSSTDSISSRGTSTYSPDSQSTSVPDSPTTAFGPRPSGPSEFSSFLDRYYFHQSSSQSGAGDSYGTPTPSDYSTTPRRVSTAAQSSCAQVSYYGSSNSSGASTPNREDSATTPMDTFSSPFGPLGPAAIAG